MGSVSFRLSSYLQLHVPSSYQLHIWPPERFCSLLPQPVWTAVANAFAQVLDLPMRPSLCNPLGQLIVSSLLEAFELSPIHLSRP